MHYRACHRFMILTPNRRVQREVWVVTHTNHSPIKTKTKAEVYFTLVYKRDLLIGNKRKTVYNYCISQHYLACCDVCFLFYFSDWSIRRSQCSWSIQSSQRCIVKCSFYWEFCILQLHWDLLILETVSNSSLWATDKCMVVHTIGALFDLQRTSLRDKVS